MAASPERHRGSPAAGDALGAAAVASPPWLEALAQSLHSGTAVFDPDLRLAWADEGFAAWLGVPRSGLLGLPAKEVLARHPAVAEAVRQAAEPGGAEARNEEASVRAVPSAAGRPPFVLVTLPPASATAASGPVAAHADPRPPEAGPRGEGSLLAAELKHARLAEVFAQAPAFLAVLRGPQHVFELANPVYLRIVGREVVGKPAREALPEVEGQGLFELLDEVYRTGRPFHGTELQVLLRSDGRPDAPLEPRYFNFVYQPLREADGSVGGILAHGIDVTEQVVARRRVEALANLNRIITDNATSALFMMDRQGRATFLNREAEVLFGWRLEELRDRALHDVVHHHRPDGSPYPMAECPLDSALPLNQRVRDHEAVFFRRDGTPFPVVCAASPILDHGVPVGTVVEVRDISEPRRTRDAVRASEERFRSLSASSPVGIFTAGLDGKCTYANPRVQAICGFERDVDMLGYGWTTHVHPDDRDAVMAKWTTALSQGVEYHQEFRWVHPDRGVRWSSVRAAAMVGDAGVPMGYVGTVEDITSRKQYEEELRAANERLQELDRLKTHLLNTASHELRTPLTPIQLQLHLLRTSEHDPERQRRALDLLDRNVGRLANLVHDMLEVSRLQSGRLRLERTEVDLAAVVAEAVESFDEPAKRSGVALRVQRAGPVPCHVDAQRITQVLYNLLSNALKFTPPGGRVEVAVRTEEGQARVEVRDSGVGFAPADKGKLFQPFSQLHEDVPNAGGGTGLGLYICRGIVEEHGGRITAHSEGPGRGATFALTLPLAGGAGA